MSENEHLYQERIPIFPRSVKGRFRSLKWGVLILAYGVYFLLPWLRWERPVGPNQAVIFDLEGRLFHIFNLTVHPQDIFWLAGFLMLAALLLFFVTGVAGRVFCGYFCFQTLWTDVYILIERLVQGERPARIRLSKQAWNLEKFRKLGLTHLLWLLVAFLTGLSFVFYWGNAPDLAIQFFTGQAPFPAYATTLFLTATTYVMAGLAREQVCIYMCPYGRFQSVMFDKDTLVISYDQSRGEGSEGRHKLAKGYKTQEERREHGTGDCIDCGYCVQVCPTGIDIRNGPQLACIQCALCVDACDNIMDGLGWERGLVGYKSEREIEGGKTRFLKFKSIGYGIAISIVLGLTVWSMLNQSTFDMHVLKVRQPLYVTLSSGEIQNSYELKLNNKTNHDVTMRLEISNLDNAKVDFGRFQQVVIKPEKTLRVVARVNMVPAPGMPKRQNFVFRAIPIGQDDVQLVESPARFFIP
jgi:cytochrome c oxidase accessory protein FixG